MLEAISAPKLGPEEIPKPSEMQSGMIGGKRCVGSALGRRGQGSPLFYPNRVRAHKALDLLQSATGVFKIQGRISRATCIVGKREASDVLLPRQSPWEHGGGSVLKSDSRKGL